MNRFVAGGPRVSPENLPAGKTVLRFFSSCRGRFIFVSSKAPSERRLFNNLAIKATFVKL
jgi:hypothetical protein